ncbi:MAG: trypsin-like peptidase domain-containing protein [Phycisphaerae bacterium]|nr:trypsin-like peptidase domain-containing protein [Phycisphaerae bacterium]
MRNPVLTKVALAVVVGWLAAAGTTLAQDSPAHQFRRTPIVDVFEKTRDSVVNISTTRVIRSRSLMFESPLDDVFDFGPSRRMNRAVHSVGSGAVIHESGYIVTNAHVVAQASDVSVTFADQATLPAEIVAVDAEHDLAVLKVQPKRPLSTCKLGHSDDLMIGETVVAIGNPLGLQHSVSAGIVSALDRDLQFSEDVVYKGLVQTDAPINPGNSGGPLLNINGELIGINTAIRGDAQNIGFAIPVNRLWDLLPKLLDIEQRERVRFGIEVSGAQARVLAVDNDSPAAAKLAPGDRIVGMDSEKLGNGIDYYVKLLSHKPGDEIKLTVQRDDRQFDTKLKLEPIPLPDGRELAQNMLGVEVEEISTQLRQRYRLPDYAHLIVTGIDRGSPADQAGMHRGDLILRLDRLPVTSLVDAGLALERVTPGQRILVDGVRLDPFFSWNVWIPTRP